MKEFLLLSGVKKMKAMKISLRPKYFLAAVIALSLFSFVYVNLHALRSNPSANKVQAKTDHPVMVEDENEQDHQKIPVPDITVLSRIIDIAQRFVLSDH